MIQEKADEMFFRRPVLVTGGAGFIGSALARRLVGAGAEVTVVDSLIPTYGGNLFNLRDIRDRIRLNVADVRDPFAMAHLVQGQDFLFNLAGQTSHLDSMQDPMTDLEINARAQLSILEACRQRNPGIKLVFASTRQLYGRPEYLPVDERHPIHPVDINGIHKLAGESYHLLYASVYGIRSTVLRLTNTYGPGMRVKDARQTFLGIWLRSVVEGGSFDVWGGDQLRDFTYVDDCVDALMLAAADQQADGQVMNVGGDRPYSLREVAELLVAVAGMGAFELKSFPPERKRIDIGDYYCDDRLIRGRLGWIPRIALAEGLRRSVEFYKAHLGHYV